MHVGVISDVHANKTALNAVLEDMRDVDTVVSLGDVIGYGPNPVATAETVQEQTTVSLRGNHETYLEDPEKARGNSGAYQGIMHARDELSDDLFNWLTERPYRDTVNDDLGLAHGNPNPENPFGYVKPSNVTDLIPLLTEQPYTVQAVGHTHLPFIQDLRKFDSDAGVVFNPGSVGQPRDGNPKAGYAVVDMSKLPEHPVEAVTLHRTSYDVDKTVNSIAENNLPSQSGKRLQTGSLQRTRRRRDNIPFK